MRISVCGTHVANACERRVSAQQRRAGSDGWKPKSLSTLGFGSVELSIDPPPTSSAWLNLPIRCCQRCWPTRTKCCPQCECVVSLLGGTRRPCLGRLLIKVFGVFAEFYGEEGLHAGVQVEGFTSPAGPDRLRVGVLE